MTRKITYLDNKSRKGWYLYINEPGAPPRYYKYRQGEKRRIERHYKQKYVKKEPVKKFSKVVRKYRSKQQPKIRDLMIKESKVTKTVIPDIKKTTWESIKKNYKELLRPLILDEKILDMFTQEHNMKKMKMRMEHTVKLIGEKGEELCELFRGGDKTIIEVLAILNKQLKYGMEYHEYYQLPLFRKGRFSYIVKSRKGKINRVMLITKFRKEKY